MEDRAPTSDELAKMTTLARNGMEAGGIGFVVGVVLRTG
jgi:N-acyl-D-aspartate/D-glutamate deacylase